MDTFTRLLSPLAPRLSDTADRLIITGKNKSFPRLVDVARMGAQDIDQTAPGYVAGLSKQVMK
jgi:hypothetical protein